MSKYIVFKIEEKLFYDTESPLWSDYHDLQEYCKDTFDWLEEMYFFFDSLEDHRVTTFKEKGIPFFYSDTTEFEAVVKSKESLSLMDNTRKLVTLAL